MNQNPNATIAGGTSAVGVFVVWLISHFNVSITTEEAAVISGAATTIVLFIGRNGFEGVWRLLRFGSSTPKK